MTPSAAMHLRALIDDNAPVIAPGVPDALSARLVARAGFPAVYASGGAIARSMGFPDLGLLGVSEVVERTRSIVEAVEIPVVADADTGFGNALNVRRTVESFVAAGVAALHLEDQVTPKRCGHYESKALVPASEMVQKLRAGARGRVSR